MELKTLRCPSCSAIVRNLTENDTEFINCEYCGSTINILEAKSEEGDNQNLLLDLAKVEFSHKNFDKALSYVGKILEDNNNNKDALWLRFNILLQKYEGELFYSDSENDYNSYFDDDSDNPYKKYKEKAIKSLVNLFRISSDNERNNFLRKLRKQEFSKAIFNSITVLEKLNDACSQTNSEILSSVLPLYYRSALDFHRKKIPLSVKIKTEISQTEANLKKIDSESFSTLNSNYLSDLKTIETENLNKKTYSKDTNLKRTPNIILYLLFALLVLIILLLLFI